MTEAKAHKLKEYFTSVTTHDNLQPSDLSGEPFTQMKRCDSVRSNNRNNTSPIRMNDTYRSTLTIGEDYNEGYNSNISNKIID